jgi:hypothetical protein
MKILALIITLALLGVGIVSAQEEEVVIPTPLPEDTDTMIQLMKLLELKEQNDYAMALAESVKWSEYGKALIKNHNRLEQGEKIQYNSKYSHTQSVIILKQEFLSDWVPEYYSTSVGKINRYSPMGFNYRIEHKGDMWDALESGDIESLDYFKTKHERHSNITKRRNAILNK